MINEVKIEMGEKETEDFCSIFMYVSDDVKIAFAK